MYVSGACINGVKPNTAAIIHADTDRRGGKMLEAIELICERITKGGH
ncbi:MAG: hypothetical protein J6V93_02595 [Clostridia bacterium]|nr:hypothetical protein [Clostridia bacterium]